MKTASTVSKLLSPLRLFVCLCFLLIANSSYAGYYVVYPSPPPCESCYNECHSCGYHRHRVIHHSVYHRHYYYHRVRHYSRSHATIEVYYMWPGMPGYPCGNVWVPARCDDCGRCTPGYWRSRAYRVYQSTPEEPYGSYVIDNPGPDYDMSTRDNEE